MHLQLLKMFEILKNVWIENVKDAYHRNAWFPRRWMKHIPSHRTMELKTAQIFWLKCWLHLPQMTTKTNLIIHIYLLCHTKQSQLQLKHHHQCPLHHHSVASLANGHRRVYFRLACHNRTRNSSSYIAGYQTLIWRATQSNSEFRRNVGGVMKKTDV